MTTRDSASPLYPLLYRVLISPPRHPVPVLPFPAPNVGPGSIPLPPQRPILCLIFSGTHLSPTLLPPRKVRLEVMRFLPSCAIAYPASPHPCMCFICAPRRCISRGTATGYPQLSHFRQAGARWHRALYVVRCAVYDTIHEASCRSPPPDDTPLPVSPVNIQPLQPYAAISRSLSLPFLPQTHSFALCAELEAMVLRLILDRLRCEARNPLVCGGLGTGQCDWSPPPFAIS
jgi:hypothetical protein